MKANRMMLERLARRTAEHQRTADVDAQLPDVPVLNGYQVVLIELEEPATEAFAKLTT